MDTGDPTRRRDRGVTRRELLRTGLAAGAAGAVVNGPPANHEVERRRVGHGMSGIDGSADERSEDQGRYCYGRRVVVKATSALACGRIARGGSTA